MAAGDIQVYGPFRAQDTSAIQTGLTGQGLAAADRVTVHEFQGMIYFTVIKAA